MEEESVVVHAILMKKSAAGVATMKQANTKFLFFPMGSAGDVYPFIGLALAMQERGHDVAICTSGYFADTCARVGLPFVDTLPAADFEALINDPDLWHPRRSIRAIFHRCVSPHIRPQYEQIAELARESSIVVIGSTLGFGARVAQEHLGVPLITVHLQPAILWSNYATPVLPGVLTGPEVPRWLLRMQRWVGERFILDPQICPAINRLGAELGLPKVRRILDWWNSPQSILGLYPEWYAERQPDWPPQFAHADFPFWDEPSTSKDDASLDQECRKFLEAGSPPIVFTAGSANRFGEYLFQIVPEVCRRLRCRGLLVSKFEHCLPSSLPPEVRHVRYAPFSALLPRVAAIVHHGGVGTTARALAAGIPQVIVPLAHDQFDNGARVRRLGVGAVVPRQRLTSQKLAEKLRCLQEDGGVEGRLTELKTQMAVGDSFARACGHIERFVAENPPRII